MQDLLSNPLLVVLIAMVVVNIVFLAIIAHMHMRLKKFLIGFDSKSVSDSLTFVGSGLRNLEGFREEMEKYLLGVEKRLKKSVQSVHTVRFNPYHGTGDGGNQSFATALLNEDGSGVVISSLHSRDHTRVFSKPIVNFKSEFELSEEEKDALERAKSDIDNFGI